MMRYSQRAILLFLIALLAAPGCADDRSAGSAMNSGTAATVSALHDGSAARPLRVMLIPADGGTAEGTKADFEPVFRAITQEHGLHFEIKVGQSYNTVVEAMAGEKVEIAWFGPVTYNDARQRGAAELLAVGESGGQSVYYSGIFTRSDSGLKELADLRGKSVAFGDVKSTSSFNYPVAMLLEAGVDPVNDLGAAFLTGSHSNALAALGAGKVDAACASYSSFEKAVVNGQLDPQQVVPLAKSDPIPYPPIAMHPRLDDQVKQTLRTAFNGVHESPDVTPEMIRGYGGKKVDRYRADFPEEEFDDAMAKLAGVTDELVQELLKKAAQR